MSEWQCTSDKPSKSMWRLPEFMGALFRTFPHVVHITERTLKTGNQRNTTDILFWATEQFGPRMIALDRLEEYGTTECRWAFLGTVVAFKDPHDAFAFKVRWG